MSYWVAERWENGEMTARWTSERPGQTGPWNLLEILDDLREQQCWKVYATGPVRQASMAYLQALAVHAGATAVADALQGELAEEAAADRRQARRDAALVVVGALALWLGLSWVWTLTGPPFLQGALVVGGIIAVTAVLGWVVSAKRLRRP